MNDTKEDKRIELAICMGSSCFSRGNKENITRIREYIDRYGLCGKVLLKGHLCEGLCKDGPNITVEGNVFSLSSSGCLEFILDDHIKGQE